MIYFTVIVVNILAWTGALLCFEFYKENNRLLIAPLFGVVALSVSTLLTMNVIKNEVGIVEYVYLRPMYKTWDYKGEVYETSHSLFQSK